MSTPLDLEALRKLAEAATPGPWEATGWAPKDADWLEPPNCIVDSPHGLIADTSESDRDEADAAFIAAANPTAVLSLCDRVAALERELRSAEDKIVGYKANHEITYAAFLKEERRADAAVAALRSAVADESQLPADHPDAWVGKEPR